MITHLYIELNGITEEINNLIVDKLYDLATSGDLDETSDLKGRLHTNLGYRYKIDYLNDAYPDLYSIWSLLPSSQMKGISELPQS